MRGVYGRVALGVALVLALASAGCGLADTSRVSGGAAVASWASSTTSSQATASTSAAASSTTNGAVKGTALAALAILPVKGRAAKTGYDRDQFGHSWVDVDRNGCDTRNDILRRDLDPST